MSRVRRRLRVFSRTLETSARPCATASEPCSTDAVDRLVCFTSAPHLMSDGVTHPMHEVRDGASDLRPRARDAEGPFPRPCTMVGRCPRTPQPLSCVAMARKKLQPVTKEDARAIGAMLQGPPTGRRLPGGPGRGGRRRIPRRATDDLRVRARRPDTLAPAVPRAHRVLRVASVPRRRRKPEDDLRAQAVASVTRALTLPAYHVKQAHELMERLQPRLAEGQRRKRRGS